MGGGEGEQGSGARKGTCREGDRRTCTCNHQLTFFSLDNLLTCGGCDSTHPSWTLGYLQLTPADDLPCHCNRNIQRHGIGETCRTHTQTYSVTHTHTQT